MTRGVRAWVAASIALAACVAAGGCGGPAVNAASETLEGTEQAILTDAPHVPPPITRTHPSKGPTTSICTP